MAFDKDGVFPSRMRGKSGKFLLGGVHMTDNPYPPFLLAKTITCTECGENIKELLTKLRDCFVGEACQGLDDEERMRKLMQMLDRTSPYESRMMKIDASRIELGDAYYAPWFLVCHPDRFPGWFGHVDERMARAIRTV